MTITASDTSALSVVRDRVQRILTESSAFRALSSARRRDLAHDMVRIANYIVGGETGQDTPTSATLARSAPARLAANTASGRLAESGATAAREGVQQLAQAVDAVDFPNFVRGLIDGVFNAIVDASIRQMEAYSELVKNVAKSVDQYMKDNVTENQARDYLVGRYPDHLELDISDEKPRVKARQGRNEENTPDFAQDLGLPPDQQAGSLDDDAVEGVLVPAARRRMAMDRQQLLATMIMMGINRLVVTDGTIDASCLFELRTTDLVGRQSAYASDYEFKDKFSSSYRNSGWFSPDVRSSYDASRNLKVTTSNDEQSESKVNLHAKLSGKVKVNFKSDFLPLEKMADVMQISRIREKTPEKTAVPATAVPGR